MEPTATALERWQRIVQQLKDGKRPHINPQLRRHYAEALEEALAESVPADRIIPDLDLLPSGVVGKAYGEAHDRLTAQRSEEILDWISSCDQERADLERAYALRKLIISAPAVAFRMLCAMRGSPPKDQRERLAAALAHVTVSSIVQVLAAQDREYEVRKAVELLLASALQGRVDQRIRAVVLEGVAPSITRFSLDRGAIGAEVRKGVEAMLAALEESSALRLRRLLRNEAQGSAAKLSDENSSTVQRSLEPAVCEERRAPHTSTERGEATAAVTHRPDPLAWFDANIQMLTHVRDFYLAARSEAEAARAEAEAERTRRAEAEASIADRTRLAERLSQAEARLQALEAQTSEATRERDSVKSDLVQAVNDLRTERELRQSKELELQQAMEGFARERDSLQRRIETNAEFRLRDFRIALSSALKPLLQDVPSPESGRSNGLEGFLLVRIDQIFRTLAEKGVELRRSAGGEA